MKAPKNGCEWCGAQGGKEMPTYRGRLSACVSLDALPEREMLQHLQEAADVVAHELPQDGQQQLVLAIQDVDAADVHQRQRQHPPRDAHHLQAELPAAIARTSNLGPHSLARPAGGSCGAV